MSRIMEIIDERETQKRNRDWKEEGGIEAIVKEWELNYFVVHLS